MRCEFDHSDAAYVLGSLSPAERLAFEQHLPGCESCSRSVRELAGLPGLLSRVSPDVLESSREPVPDSLLPSLTKRARLLQRRRRWAVAGVAAAATAVVAAGSAGIVTALNGPQQEVAPTVSSAPPEAMQPVGVGEMTADLAITSVPWGTRLDLSCQYDLSEVGEYPWLSSATYVLIIRTDDGRVEKVATWRLPESGEMRLSAATAIPKDDISEVSIRLAGGPTEMRLVT